MGRDISVVLCTYNRSAMLEDSLESWRQVQQAGFVVEFVVIDNASTDETRSVVERMSVDFPCALRYEYEGNPGLSFARNHGIDSAGGKLIAFVDDDIFFDPGWLVEIIAAFKRHPEIHCVGGKSIPMFEVSTPEWLTESMLKFYGSTLSGDVDRHMVFPEHPFGVNMVFRRDVFETVGKFRTNLGRIKDSLLSNEEKDIFYRIHAAGLKVFYASRAVLQHRIPAERLSKAWLLRRAYWQGISNVVFDQSTRRRSRGYLLKHLLRNARRIVLGPNGGQPDEVLRHYRNHDFEASIRTYNMLGIVRQDFVELFRRSS